MVQSIRNLSRGRNNQGWQKAATRIHGHTELKSQMSDFNGLLRKFLKRSHPDLIKHSHPEYFDVNTTSLQVLNDILEIAKTPGKHPSMITKDLTFYIRDAKVSSKVLPHTLKIRTSGGHCRSSLTENFEEFFRITQITDGDGKFYWNEEYFTLPVNSNNQPIVEERKEDSMRGEWEEEEGSEEEQQRRRRRRH